MDSSWIGREVVILGGKGDRVKKKSFPNLVKQRPRIGADGETVSAGIHAPHIGNFKATSRTLEYGAFDSILPIFIDRTLCEIYSIHEKRILFSANNS